MIGVGWGQLHQAAVIIQRNVRMWLDRTMVLLSLYDRAMLALVKIQAWSRGYLARKAMGKEITDIRMKVRGRRRPSLHWGRDREGRAHNDQAPIFPQPQLPLSPFSEVVRG